MVRSRDPWGNEISESIDRQFYIDTETGRLYPSYNDALQDISTLGKNTLYGFYSTGQVRAIDGTVIKKGELAFVDSASDQVFASPQDALAYRGEYGHHGSLWLTGKSRTDSRMGLWQVRCSNKKTHRQ